MILNGGATTTPPHGVHCPLSKIALFFVRKLGNFFGFCGAFFKKRPHTSGTCCAYTYAHGVADDPRGRTTLYLDVDEDQEDLIRVDGDQKDDALTAQVVAYKWSRMIGNYIKFQN